MRKWPTGVGKDGKSWDDLWLDYEHLLLTRKLLFLEKSRRVLASWTVCAFDVWLAAGGRDPRWSYTEPDGTVHHPLLESAGNRMIVLGAQKAEGQFGSQWFIEKRIKNILQCSEANGLRSKWPDFPEWNHKQGIIQFSNGSDIAGVPSGSDQMRGGGITFIHGEEIAFWENARAAIGGAIPTLSGVAHLVGLTTPKVGTYAAEIVQGTTGSVERFSAKNRTDEDGEPGTRVFVMPSVGGEAGTRVLPVRDLPNGWTIATASWQTVPEYDYEAIARTMDPMTRRQELDLDWTASSGKLVYPKFDRGRHVAVEPLEFNPEWPLIVGWDLPGANGGTPAAVPVQINGWGQVQVWNAIVPRKERSISFYDFAHWVASEIYTRFAQPHGLYIRKEPKIRIVHYGDPAGRQRPPRTALGGNERLELRSAVEILRDGDEDFFSHFDENGNPVMEPRPGWGWDMQNGEVSLRKRMETFAALLDPQVHTGLPGLVIDPGANIIIEALGGGYSYKERHDGTYETEPEKNWYSHCLTGETLIETARGHVPIRDVVAGSDLVWTRAGWKRVEGAWVSGIRRVVEVRLDNGAFIRATRNHRVWADGGWVLAGGLRYNQVCDVRPSPSMGGYLPATPTLPGDPTRFTTELAMDLRTSGCTLPSGNRFTDRSPLAGMCTTVTATPTTTRSRTSNACLLPITTRRMRPSASIKPSVFGSTWKGCVRLLLRGTGRKKAGSGTASMVAQWRLKLQRRVTCATTAGKPTRVTRPMAGTASAAGCASRPTAGSPEWTTRPALARSAAESFPPISTATPRTAPVVVRSVTAIPGKHVVYDLLVEGAHEFYAGGVLVHNSINALEYCLSRLGSMRAGPEEDVDYDLPRGGPRRRAAGRGLKSQW